MPATAEQPAIVSTPPSKPVPPPTTTINVSAMPKGDVPVAPPKPGSARAKMREELAKAAGVEPPKEAAAEVPAAQQPAAEAERPGDAPPDAGEVSDQPSTAPIEPAATGEQQQGKKPSPWKLVDQFKERAVKAEARALELEKQVIPEPERKATTEKIAKYEARLKELEDVVRFADYRKSEEFQTKYQKPYEAAWENAMKELGEVPLTDPTSGQPRAMTANDLLELVNLPLPKAREIADQVFGAFADDVMAQRKEIKRLFEAQSQALKEAQENGSKRDAERRQSLTRAQEEIQGFIKSEWDKTNQQLLADEKLGGFFKPREGDEQWNGALTKGFELVDGAFSQNANDPNLTPEQRSAIVRRHAAVRNRAAGWAAMRVDRDQWKAKAEAFEKELAKFKSSTPATGGQQPVSTAASPAKAKDQMFAALQKLAH